MTGERHGVVEDDVKKSFRVYEKLMKDK